MNIMIFKKLVQELKGTRKRLRDVCEDMGLEYEDLYEEDIGIYQCASCSTWHTTLKEDLDGSPICSYCEALIGR